MSLQGLVFVLLKSSLTVVVVFQGTIQDVTHPDIVLAECDRQPQRLEQRRKGRPGQSGGILFEFVGHPEFKRPTLLPFVFIEGARRDLDDRHLVDLALESLDQNLSIRISRSESLDQILSMDDRLNRLVRHRHPLRFSDGQT